MTTPAIASNAASPPKVRLTYRKMTSDEKHAQFGEHDPAYHVFLVFPSKEHDDIGYVYQKPLSRAGKLWRDTGHTQAWIAVGRYGRMADHPSGDYYPTRTLAADAIYRKWRQMQGQIATR